MLAKDRIFTRVAAEIAYGPEGLTALLDDRCPSCKEAIDLAKMRDEPSVHEYRISGLCQKCQDAVFTPAEEE